jgi:cobalt-zinc-cadmium efflux system outer membrane protein
MKIPLLLVLAALAALGGCAAVTPSASSARVDELVSSRTGISPDVARPRAVPDVANDPLPTGPIGVTAAVRLAFMNNPRLRTAYATLGIAAADVFDASRLSNPSLSLSVLDSDAGGAVLRITAALVQNFTDALLLPARRELATGAARQRAFDVASDLWNLAQDVSAAHTAAVGARQRAALRALAVRATGLSAELARRYFAAGNINRLELTLAEAAISEAELDAAMATAAADAARIRLQQLLGLRGNQQLQLPSGLLLPVATEDELAPLQTLAMNERLDLKAAAAAVAVGESALDMNRRYRYLGTIEGGIEFERDSDESLLLGPTLNLELPLFNQGQGRIARSSANLAQRHASVDALALAIEHDIAVAHTRVLAARERVEIFQQRFVPARRAIVLRTQEMQNFQIVSPFESLRAKIAEYDAYDGYINALRDYWLARTSLTRAVGTALPSSAQAGEAQLDTAALTGAPGGANNSSAMPPGPHEHAHGPEQHP